MDLDSPLAREEAKWSSTPSYRALTACRINMHLPLERPAEACCFLQAASVAKTQLALLRNLCGGAYGLRLHTQGSNQAPAPSKHQQEMER